MANIYSHLGPSPTKSQVLRLTSDCDSLFKRMRQPEPGEPIEAYVQLRELHERFIDWANPLGLFATGIAPRNFRPRNFAIWHDEVWPALARLRFGLYHFLISEAEPPDSIQVRKSRVLLNTVRLSVKDLELSTIFITQPPMSPLDLQIRAFRATEAEGDIARFETIAILSLRSLYSATPEDLIRLLAKSMTDRFAKLLYWQSLDRKLQRESRPAKIPDDKVQLTRATTWLETRPKHDKCSHDGLKRSQSSPTTSQQQTVVSYTEPPTPPDENLVGYLEADLSLSVRDDSSSIVQIDKIGYPPQPKPRHSKCQAKCLFCTKALTKDKLEPKNNWRRHVDEDLSPFVCISNDCDPAPSFSKYDHWAQHMIHYHGEHWTQTIYLNGIDDEEIERRAHPNASIIDGVPFEMEGALLYRDKKYCLLCSLPLERTHQDWISREAEVSSDPVKLMSRHIATHLQFITQLSIYLGRAFGLLPEEDLSQPITSASSSKVVLPESQQAMSETSLVVDSEPGRPGIFCVPLPKNKQFTGRETILNELKERLFWEGGSQHRIAIFGPSGVGKTQLALQLAYWAEDAKPEYSIFWIPAWSFASFEQACRELMKRLDLHVNEEEEDIKDFVRNYLESRECERWLLIVDNADDKEIVFGPPDNYGGIHQYLPLSEHAAILYTTRSEEVKDKMGYMGSLSLNEMSLEEARSFLECALVDNYKQPPLLYEASTAGELLKELAYFPSAIAQAAAYLNLNRIPMEKYLALLRGMNQHLASPISRGSDCQGLHSAVAVTSLISFDQICRSNEKAAAEMLLFMSCIRPKAIPRSILPGPLAQKEKEHAISVLCEYSFLTRRVTDTFDMDPSVYLALLVWIRWHGSMEMTKVNAIQQLVSVFSQNTESEIRRQYIPHALYALQNSRGLQIEERAELLLQVGSCSCEDILANVYVGNGRITDVIEIFEHTAASLQKTLVEDDPVIIMLENNLAHAYLQNGQVIDAIEILERIVDVSQRTLEEEDSARLASENNLAQAYLQDGRVALAINIFEHITGVCQRSLSEKDKTMLSLKRALGKAYLEGGRITEAINIFDRIKKIEDTLGLSHYRVLESSDLLDEAFRAE
ncbi:hypothetical protein GGR51DRAFT_563431 [Nemania sp. FL0031]|nr:hypothetical protein GGR51DRAFT_563431 [Nemania sp. FL0031]